MTIRESGCLNQELACILTMKTALSILSCELKLRAVRTEIDPDCPNRDPRPIPQRVRPTILKGRPRNTPIQ